MSRFDFQLSNVLYQKRRQGLQLDSDEEESEEEEQTQEPEQPK